MVIFYLGRWEKETVPAPVHSRPMHEQPGIHPRTQSVSQANSPLNMLKFSRVHSLDRWEMLLFRHASNLSISSLECSKWNLVYKVSWARNVKRWSLEGTRNNKSKVYGKISRIGGWRPVVLISALLRYRLGSNFVAFLQWYLIPGT